MNEDAIAVLLVEDNLADVAMLMELLQGSNAQDWQVTPVTRLRSALEQLYISHFDVVLLDLSLPDSQGLDTIAQLQAAFPYLPIVVLTGLEDKTIARQAVAQGAQDYLVKGQLSSELLLKTVSYAIERSQILKRLQESEHRFRGVFNQTFQCMSLLSVEGVILDVNKITIEISGLQEETILNTPIWEAPCWKPFEPSQSWLKEAVLRAAQGAILRSELQARTSQGTVWLDFSIKPLRNESGTIMLLIAEGRDVSKLKRAEVGIRRSLEKERELNQMKNSFISMIAHEFRNPLAFISFVIAWLESGDLSAEKQQQYLGQARNKISQTLKLLDEILVLGQTDVSQGQADYTLLELVAVCREIVEDFQLTKAASHDILFSVEGSSTQARMDQSLLKHILDNLLSNAIKYSPAGGTIRFTLTCQDNQAKFCIQDQGIGIPEKDQPKLFEVFHRAGNVSKIQGTGLGLAIVKRCVDLHNGEIHVESQEGTGTTFTVMLPLNIKSEEQKSLGDACRR